LSDVLIVLFGLGVGMSVGLTGVGGGSFLTPFLVIVLRVHPAVAVVTSLVFTLVTRAAGSLQHLRQGTVDLIAVRHLALGSVPAAILASLALIHFGGDGGASDPVRTRLIQACLFVAAAVLTYRLFVPATPGLGDNNPVKLALLGVLVGTMVALSSVGSGSVAVAGLIGLTSLPIARVVGTDMVHAVILAGVAAPLALLQTTFDFHLAALLLLGSLPGVVVGSRLAVLVPERITRFTVTLAVWTLALKVA
jgi:uncharacterized membrane protein YfcA